MRFGKKVALLIIVLSVARTAVARRPEDVFAGKILLSDKAFLRAAKSTAAYISGLRKQSRDRFMEDKEKREWKIHYAAFFAKPVSELEVVAKFFDVSSGSRRLVESYEQYLDTRGQRAIVGNVTLRKGVGAYDANTKILMVMESNGRVLAQTSFFIGGEKKKYSGKAQFSEEEANSDELDEDPDDQAERK